MAQIYDNYYTFKAPDLFNVGARVRLFRRTDGHGVILVSELPDSARNGGNLSPYDLVLREMHELMTGEFMVYDYTFIDHHAHDNLVRDADGRVVGTRPSERFVHKFFTINEDGSAEYIRESGLTRSRAQELCEESLVD